MSQCKDFFQAACLQTLSQLMFNEFKQDCYDVKATVSIWTQAKVNSRVTADQVLAH